MKTNFVKISSVFFIFSLSLNIFAGENKNKESTDRILNKIQFMSDCEVKDVAFRCLNQDLRSEELCSEFGVTSCEARSVYTNIAKTWVMTSTKLDVNASLMASVNSTALASNAASVASANAASAAAASAAAASAAASMHAAPPPM